MCSVRSYRLLGRHALPIVQVGLEERSSRQRECNFARAPEAFSAGTLIARAKGSSSSTNIFVPEVWMVGDEFAHHCNAFCVIEMHDLDSTLPE
jgi:hypothetical protein